jgi:transcriptional regulator with XRE-family HTH domain
MERNEELLRKFGRQLSTLRKQKGLSVRELAAAAGMKTDQLKKIEAGQAGFLLSTLVALAAGLKISPAALFKGL